MRRLATLALLIAAGLGFAGCVDGFVVDSGRVIVYDADGAIGPAEGLRACQASGGRAFLRYDPAPDAFRKMISDVGDSGATTKLAVCR